MRTYARKALLVPRLLRIQRTTPPLTFTRLSCTMSDPPKEKFVPFFPDFDQNNCQSYDASCHCGEVTWSVLLSPPLPEWKVVSCNCSICTCNAYLLVYPEKKYVDVKSGADSIREYTFNRHQTVHKFCSKCGSALYHDPRVPAVAPGQKDILGINVSSNYQYCKYLTDNDQVRMFQNVKVEELDVVYADNRD